MNTLYDAGPRLSETIEGDRYRQAVAGLGGYAYQLVASADAWLDLRDDETLYLEVAEDYAVAVRDALAAVQVKATASSITLLSPTVGQAIDSVIDLAERNPGRAVTLRLLTTAPIGREHSADDRPNGIAGLKYWRQAAAGADVAPLRGVLLASADLSERAKAFISARDDEALRRDLLRRIHWDTEQPGLASLQTQLATRLIDRGTHVHSLPVDSCRQLVWLVLGQLLEVASTKDPARRVLTRVALDRRIDAATRVGIRPKELDAMLAAVTGRPVGEQPMHISAMSSFLRRDDETPLPVGLSSRPAPVATIAAAVQRHQTAIIVGGTGTGKTTLARLAARTFPGAWIICHVLEAAPEAVAERVNHLLLRIGSSTVRGVILDDLTGFDAPVTQAAVARLITALRRRDQLFLITAYRAPSARVLSGVFALDAQSVLQAPYLDVHETIEVVAAGGGDAQEWARAVHNASSHGHPQLTHAIVMGLAARRWPKEERAALLAVVPSAIDIDAERASIRQRLLAAVPDSARALLYRTSLVLGPFSRHVAMALGQVTPNIPMPGEVLEQLSGPWLDAIGGMWFRASPLVAQAGRELLDAGEQNRVHRAIAEHTLTQSQLDPIEVDVAFSHALIAKSQPALFKIAHSVIFATERDLEMISEWMISLRDHPTDRRICPENLALSYLLRLAQVLLLGPGANDGSVAAAVNALYTELDAEPDPQLRDRFHYIALSKLFFRQSLAGRLPQWFGRFLQLREILSRNAELASNVRALEKANPAQPSVVGTHFMAQATGLRSIAQLSELFDALDALKDADREDILNRGLIRPDAMLFIDTAWMREHRKGTIDGVDGAARFLRMSQQAERWGHRDLALRCHVARGIMIDEYQGQSDAALGALDEAAHRWGEDPVITRARAKVLYRRKDHSGALDLISSVAGSVALDSPVEKVFMLREAAISASEIGEWSRARKWYAAAHDVAVASPVPSMRPMAVGLFADLAVAELLDDDRPAALRHLAVALTSLSSMQPESSLAAYYCHSIVRHAVLWCLSQVSPEDLLVDGEAPQMLPGWCSNPEPSEAILKKPLAPLEAGWYLLARADLMTGGHAGIAANLSTHLAGRHVVQMEVLFAHDQVDSAISASDPERFAAQLRSWVDARVFSRNNLATMSTSAMEKPIYARIPPASDEELCTEDIVEAVERAVLAFALSAVFKGRVDLLEQLRSRLNEQASAMCIQGPVKQLLDSVGDPGAQPSGIAAMVRRVAASDMVPDDLFVATVRFLEVVRVSMFAATLGPMLSSWVQRAWRNVIKNQRFHLRTPNSTSQVIETALSVAGDDIASVARIILAAEPAVRTSLSPELLAQLKAIT